MFLKSLEIQGFKSFPDKVKLDFMAGITAIVGPNGSGKSNIVDAIRWVMGEQSAKSLRGGRMEDVIFGGTQKRKGLGFAQVSITIDNSTKIVDMDSEELCITRKYYRSGESEYRINKNVVRLKDVHELLMDTGLGRDGYSIIGQGKIAEIVSAKNVERREIFEEAAGISKFRYRKEQAEHKLELAQENLLRLKDIITEIEERIGPLKTQSEKALLFVDLANKQKKLEVSISVEQIKNIKLELQNQEGKIALSKENYLNIENEIKSIEDKFINIHDEMSKITFEVERIRREKEDSENQVRERISQVSVYENDIFHKSESLKRLREEVQESDSSIVDINIQIENYKKQIEHLLLDIKDLEDKREEIHANIRENLVKLESQNDIVNVLNKEISELDKKISECTIEELTSESYVQEMSSRSQGLEESILETEEYIEKTEKENSELNIFISELDERIKQEENILSGFSIKQKNQKLKLQDINKNLNTINMHIKEAEQRTRILYDMENNMEDFSRSVKLIMKLKEQKRISGIHGTISQLINVSSEYALAIETALSAGIQNIVVDSEESAKSAINILKKEKAGRATFLPLNSVKGTRVEVERFKNFPGFVDLAVNLIRFDSKYNGIMNSMLGRIVLCEDLDSAVALARQEKYRFRIVTLDGQIVNAGGSLTGGSNIKNAGILSRRGEISLLQENIKKYKAEYNSLFESYGKTEKQINLIAADCVNWESSIKILQEDKIKSKYQINSLEINLENSKKQIINMQKEKNSIFDKIKVLNDKLEKNKKIYQELLKQKLEKEEQLKNLGFDQEELKNQRNKQNEKLSDYQMKIISLRKDKDMFDKMIEDLTNRKNNTSDHVKGIYSQIEELEKNIVEIKKSISQHDDLNQKVQLNIKEMESNIIVLEQNRQTLEKQVSEIRQEEKELMAQKEGLSKEITRLEERQKSYEIEYDKIIANLWDEYEITMSEAVELSNQIEDFSKAKTRLAEIKSKIKSLGSVNVDAIEEYKEVSQRYEFMKTQCDDVEKSRDELLKLIQNLSKNMKEIFQENFEKINIKFIETFKDMFGGGDARLELTDKENILESGIEIYVQPPGKIIKNLSSLSGGEQALVAISIYFAILNVKPSPFCVLDEIEAALDEVNVERYASYLRKMTDNTQFIAISHRRGTMEEADSLYGVTMQEEGVSKMLKLKVSEIEEKLGVKI